MDIDVLGYNLNNIMENYYQFKYLSEVLSKKALKEYKINKKPSNRKVNSAFSYYK